MPNMVRNERSLCAHKVRNICRRISKNSIAVNGDSAPFSYTQVREAWFLRRTPLLLDNKGGINDSKL